MPVVEYTEPDKIEKVELQPKWKNAPDYQDLYNDYLASADAQDIFRTKLLKYQETRDGGKEIECKKGKSNARPKLVRKQNEWKYAALEEPFLNTVDMFDLNPRTWEDTDAAEQNGIVLNYQWGSKINKTKLIGDVVRNLVDEGTAIVKTGWESEIGIDEVETEEPVYASPEESFKIMQEQVQAGQMAPEQAQAMMEMGQPIQTGTKKVYTEQEHLITNQPSYEVCNNAHVTIDPTCEGVLSEAKFVIHEYDLSYSELQKDEYDPETKTGFYYNIDYAYNSGEEGMYDPHYSTAKNNFKFKDKSRKLLKAYEYWGYWDINNDGELVAIVATWVGKTLVRLEENPFPHGRVPFSVTTYMPVKKEIHGEPDAAILVENQESIGSMQRAIHDITAKAAVMQEFIDESLFPSPSQKNAYEKGNTVYVRSGFDPAKQIYRQSVEKVPSVVFDVINYQTQDAELLTGTKAFGASTDTSGKVAAGVRSATDAASKREQGVLRRMSDLLFRDLARMTISMNQAFLSEEEVVRITNGNFVTVRRDDLAGEFDIRIEVATPEKDDDTAQKLMTLMQTNGANMDPEIANMHYYKIAMLWKQPDLAKAVKEHKPKPDPLQEQIKQLQIEKLRLENEQLKMDMLEAASKIGERDSRASENEFDSANKEAQAELRFAQAAKTKAETDMLDQEFIDKDSGSKRQREVEDATHASREAENKDKRKLISDQYLSEQKAINDRLAQSSKITQGNK